MIKTIRINQTKFGYEALITLSDNSIRLINADILNKLFEEIKCYQVQEQK